MQFIGVRADNCLPRATAKDAKKEVKNFAAASEINGIKLKLFVKNKIPNLFEKLGILFFIRRYIFISEIIFPNKLRELLDSFEFLLGYRQPNSVLRQVPKHDRTRT